MSTGRIRAAVIGAVLGAGAALSAGPLTACGGGGLVGSGTAAAQTRHLAAFSSVDLAGSGNVTIRAGGRQSVVVHADDNLLGQVTTQVHATTLVIGTRGSFTTSSPMSVEISVPSLEAVTLSGGGSGAITASNIQAPRVSVRLSGSGVVRASGTVTRLDVSLGGSGDAQLGQLVARDVHAVLDGSGRIVTHVTNTLQASVPGSGTIVYNGNPAHVTRSITGSGAITRQ
jgi:Putative auto-transporter adhesin, head GIN domain